MKNTTILKIVGIIVLCIAATVGLTFAFNEVLKHDEPLVYVTKTGKKYHSEDCSYLRQSRIPIGQVEAENDGYTPCSRCGGESRGTVTIDNYGGAFGVSVCIVAAFVIMGFILYRIKSNNEVIDRVKA